MRPALCGYLETLDEAAFGAASESSRSSPELRSNRQGRRQMARPDAHLPGQPSEAALRPEHGRPVHPSGPHPQPELDTVGRCGAQASDPTGLGAASDVGRGLAVTLAAAGKTIIAALALPTGPVFAVHDGVPFH